MGNPVKGGKFAKRPHDYDTAARGEFHLGPDVSPVAFLVWHLLLAGADGDGGNAYTTRATLAAQSGVSVATVKRALKELRDKAAIVYVSGGKGPNNPAEYKVLPLPGRTEPASEADRLSPRHRARVNAARRRAGLGGLDRDRWNDPENGSLVTRTRGRDRVKNDTENGSLVNPYQYPNQESADGLTDSDEATGPADEWVPAEEPPSPADEETFPEDRDESSGTSADQRADSVAGLLDQGNNDGTGSREASPGSRASVPVAADLAEPRTDGSRGHLAGVPLLDRSSRATGRAQQLNSDDEEQAS